MPNTTCTYKTIQLKAKPNFLNLKLLPIALLDYIWIIIFYFGLAFWLAVIIDGYILPPFIEKDEIKKPSWLLFIEVFTHIALQGFIAFVVHAVISYIPSPVNGLYGYNVTSTLGTFLRNPAIITTMLLFLSNTLHQRMLLLFSRFNKNYVSVHS